MLKLLHRLIRELFDARALAEARTDLIFMMLEGLPENRAAGHEIKHVLGKNNLGMSGPRFYALMARLEDDGVVRGYWDEEVITVTSNRTGTVSQRRLTERWFRLRKPFPRA